MLVDVRKLRKNGFKEKKKKNNTYIFRPFYRLYY